jgi:hypothetical protein
VGRASTGTRRRILIPSNISDGVGEVLELLIDIGDLLSTASTFKTRRTKLCINSQPSGKVKTLFLLRNPFCCFTGNFRRSATGARCSLVTLYLHLRPLIRTSFSDNFIFESALHCQGVRVCLTLRALQASQLPCCKQLTERSTNSLTYAGTRKLSVSWISCAS